MASSIQFSNIGPIFRREVRSYFNSPVAYVVIIAFLAIVGWFFTDTLFINNVASLGDVFTWARIAFLIFIPALTMRLLAEEKKSGTLELLTTKPVHDVEIVLGKFLAGWALVGVALAPTLVYFITVASIGKIDMGPALLGYLGLFLVGGVYVSIGVLASSLTENQIVAFILSFFLVFILFMLDKILFFVPAGLASTLEFLSIDFHFNGMARGVIDSRNVIYFASLLGLSLMLSTVSLERRKW